MAAAPNNRGAAGATDDDAAAAPQPASIVGDYDVDLKSILGQSSFCTVFSARHRASGERVALKAIEMAADNVLGYANELAIHRRASGHKFLVQLLDFVLSEHFAYLALEFCDGGDVFHQIVPHVGLGQREMVGIYFSQLAEAVDYLHASGIAHLDIKPENMLVSGQQIKLGDFGVSVLIEDGPVSDCRGSVSYAAPENIQCYRRASLARAYDPAKADVWSCGVVLFVLMYGHTPWSAAKDSSLDFRQYKSTDGAPNCKPWNCMSTIRNVFRRTLSVSPNQRWTSAELKYHLTHVMGWNADQRVPLRSPVASPRRSLSRRFSEMSASLLQPP